MTNVTQAEQERIAGFVAQVAGLEVDAHTYRWKAMNELRWVHRHKNNKGDRYSPAYNRKLISAYRNAIVGEFGENSAEWLLMKSYMHLSVSRTKEYKAHQMSVREAKHHNLRYLDADEFVDEAMLLLWQCVNGGWRTPSAIVSLCALTGRRPAEIGLTAQFDPLPGSRSEADFTGQLKTRGQNPAAEIYTIPILGDRDLVVQGMEMMRREVDQSITPAKFNSRYGKEYGKMSVRIFQDVDGEPIITKDLREAYAAVAFYQFAPDNVTEIQYKSRLLGHKFMDITLDYVGFEVCEMD